MAAATSGSGQTDQKSIVFESGYLPMTADLGCR